MQYFRDSWKYGGYEAKRRRRNRIITSIIGGPLMCCMLAAIYVVLTRFNLESWQLWLVIGMFGICLVGITVVIIVLFINNRNKNTSAG